MELGYDTLAKKPEAIYRLYGLIDGRSAKIQICCTERVKLQPFSDDHSSQRSREYRRPIFAPDPAKIVLSARAI